MRANLTRLLLACGALVKTPSIFTGYFLAPRPTQTSQRHEPYRYGQERYDAAVAKRKRRAEKLSKEHP